jgi:hypothetical protein
VRVPGEPGRLTGENGQQSEGCARYDENQS